LRVFVLFLNEGNPKSEHSQTEESFLSLWTQLKFKNLVYGPIQKKKKPVCAALYARQVFFSIIQK
jgi:hypothetical protein